MQEFRKNPTHSGFVELRKQPLLGGSGGMPPRKVLKIPIRRQVLVSFGQFFVSTVSQVQAHCH